MIILIYHRIGAGKTCTAINIAEQWKHKKKIIVLVPASLIGNIRDELRSQCAGNSYLTEKEREKFIIRGFKVWQVSVHHWFAFLHTSQTPFTPAELAFNALFCWALTIVLGEDELCNFGSNAESEASMLSRE